MPLPSFDPYVGARVLVTGGLGFIGSHLSKKLVELGSEVTIVDSLIPEYGGNPYNTREIADAVHVNYSGIREPWSIRCLLGGMASSVDAQRRGVRLPSLHSLTPLFASDCSQTAASGASVATCPRTAW
jgi:NAD(P)-dependent dehydrogenase (short-subunit alcohol dehydrogenase family)